MDKFVQMDKFVAQLNIEHFQRQLVEEIDPLLRARLQQLLREEEAKLAQLTEIGNGKRVGESR